MRYIWIILAIWFATAAQAGPWQRPVSTGFMSSSSTFTVSNHDLSLTYYSVLYVEYGLSKTTTLGFSGGLNEINKINGHAFLRRPIKTWESGWLLAYEIGLGGTYHLGASTPEVRLGLTLGRGITIRQRKGWFTFDTSLTKSREDWNWTSETTLGVTARNKWKWIAQVTAEKSRYQPAHISVSPSVAFPLGKRAHLQVGLIGESRGGGRVGIKTSIWREF